jgi:hypothetical protein
MNDVESTIAEQAAQTAEDWVTAWKQTPLPATIHKDTIHFGRKKITREDFEILLRDRAKARADRVVLIEALEQLHARITRDFNFEASESAAPEDERWARTIDDFVGFADEIADEIETKVGY